jgi:hypothetical protein
MPNISHECDQGRAARSRPPARDAEVDRRPKGAKGARVQRCAARIAQPVIDAIQPLIYSMADQTGYVSAMVRRNLPILIVREEPVSL